MVSEIQLHVYTSSIESGGCQVYSRPEASASQWAVRWAQPTICCQFLSLSEALHTAIVYITVGKPLNWLPSTLWDSQNQQFLQELGNSCSFLQHEVLQSEEAAIKSSVEPYGGWHDMLTSVGSEAMFSWHIFIQELAFFYIFTNTMNIPHN